MPSVACVFDECWRLVCAASSWSTERTRNGSVQKAGAVGDRRRLPFPDSAPENLPPSIVRRATSQRLVRIRCIPIEKILKELLYLNKDFDFGVCELSVHAPIFPLKNSTFGKA